MPNDAIPVPHDRAMRAHNRALRRTKLVAHAVSIVCNVRLSVPRQFLLLLRSTKDALEGKVSLHMFLLSQAICLNLHMASVCVRGLDSV